MPAVKAQPISNRSTNGENDFSSFPTSSSSFSGLFPQQKPLKTITVSSIVIIAVVLFFLLNAVSQFEKYMYVYIEKEMQKTRPELNGSFAWRTIQVWLVVCQKTVPIRRKHVKMQRFASKKVMINLFLQTFGMLLEAQSRKQQE